MNNTLEFKVKQLRKLNLDSSTKAFVDLVVNDALVIKGLRVVNGKNGLFVSMPQDLGKDKKWYDAVQPLNREIKQAISSVVLTAYDEQK